MHGLPDVPLKVGAPSSVFRPFLNSWYFRYLYQNHEGHHVLGGQVNYNVACPFTDHLVGTYVKEVGRSPSTYINACLPVRQAGRQAGWMDGRETSRSIGRSIGPVGSRSGRAVHTF